MVGLDPELRQEFVFVDDESQRLGRSLRDGEFPTRLREAFALPPSMPLELKNDLMTRIVREVSTKEVWERMFALLEQFNEREGHCNVPQLHKEEDVNLGLWVSRQRNAKKGGKLDTACERHLEKLGIVWDVLDDNWERMFALLVQYKEHEGHCNVPLHHEEKEGNLGVWVSVQRIAKKGGRLDVTREQRLEKLGIAWDIYGDQWEQMFALLEQFKDREGHCNVPQTHKEKSVNLGWWVLSQRKVKKGGSLDVTREQRLEKLGIAWDIHGDQWERMFALLEQFKDREGHCNVPRRHEEKGVNLGIWVFAQRARKGGTLDGKREGRLEKLGFVWDVRNSIDKKRFFLSTSMASVLEHFSD
jgi:hypothetical protein